MAGSKATKHPTKTDTLIRTVDQARQARGLNRHRIIPRVSQLPTGGGGQAAIGGFGSSGNFLDPTGDTMIGPIAFSPKQSFIDNSDADNPSMDIGINSGDYSTYIQVSGSNDELRTIFGASFNGQLLYLQWTGVGQLTIKQGDGTDGGNIVTNTGGDLLVNFGEVVIMLFDPTGGADPAVNGAWRVVAGGASGGGGVTQLGDLSDVDFPTALINDQVLTFNGTSMLWENKAFPTGGMTTDLSNMSDPTVPTVPLSMNLQNIIGVNTFEFDSNGTKSITTLDNIFFNQSQQSIISSANGINVKVNSNQEIVFETLIGIIAKFDEVNSTDRRLEMQGNKIQDVGKLLFSPVFNTDTSFLAQIYEESSFNNLRYVSNNAHVFVNDLGTVQMTLGDFIGNGGFLQDISKFKMLSTTVQTASVDGEFQMVFQSGSSGPADMFIHSGGQLRNISDIGPGGGGNEISQGNTSITIIDTGSGSITDVVDGAVVSTKSASIFTINQSIAFAGNTLSGLGDTTPSTNHFFRLGDFTLFWDQLFTDKIALQNANNTLIGSSFGITHNVPIAAIHEFEVNSIPKLTIRSDEIDVEGNNIVSVGDLNMDATSDIIMAGGDINGWDDMTAQGSTSILDMSGGDIVDWRLLTAGSGATLNMNVGDIQGVRDLIMQTSVGLIDVNGGTINSVSRITMASGGDIVMSGSSAQITGVEDITFSGGSSSFLDLNFGDAINIDRCEVNGEFNHKGTQVGFYGVSPVTVPVMTRASSGDSLAVLIARFQILQDILSQRTSGASGSDSGTGIIELFGF